MNEYLYRVYEVGTHIAMYKHLIIKRTPCGAWIDRYGHKKFVNLKAVKQYAYETQEAAWVSFKRRKARQLLILTGQAQYAKHLNEWLKTAEPPVEGGMAVRVPPQEIDIGGFFSGQL